MPTPNNPITQGSYWVVTPAANFKSKSYGNLNGSDLFFYVSQSNDLCVVNFNTNTPGNTTFVLVPGVAVWVGTISLPGVVHVYYADFGGQMWHIPYQIFGSITPATTIPVTGVNNFSVTSTPQTTPPAYMMLTDDGVFHTLYVNHATDPTFNSLLAPASKIYNNALSPTVFVTEPTVTMHPDDTKNITVICQQIDQHTDISSVGFYTVAAPGVS